MLWPTEWNLAPPPSLGHAAHSCAPVPQRVAGPASVPIGAGLLRRRLGRSRNRARDLVRGRGRVGRRLELGARVLRCVGEIGRQSWRPNGRRFGGAVRLEFRPMVKSILHNICGHLRAVDAAPKVRFSCDIYSSGKNPFSGRMGR